MAYDYFQKLIARQQATIAAQQQTIAQLQAQTVGADPTDEPLAEQITTLAGQRLPRSGTNWRMSARASALRLDALEQALAELSPQLAYNAQQIQATQAQLEANTLADQALAAYQQATAAQTQANKLDIAAGKTATAAAQAKADAAVQAAATAQTNATTAISNAAAAQSLATANQAAFAAFQARFRSKRMATPAMALGATATVTVPWDTPYADANYTTTLAIEGAGLTIKYKSHTAAAVVVEVSNLLGVNVLAGAGTINVQALHD